MADASARKPVRFEASEPAWPRSSSDTSLRACVPLLRLHRCRGSKRHDLFSRPGAEPFSSSRLPTASISSRTGSLGQASSAPRGLPQRGSLRSPSSIRRYWATLRYSGFPERREAGMAASRTTRKQPMKIANWAAIRDGDVGKAWPKNRPNCHIRSRPRVEPRTPVSTAGPKSSSRYVAAASRLERPIARRPAFAWTRAATPSRRPNNPQNSQAISAISRTSDKICNVWGTVRP